MLLAGHLCFKEGRGGCSLRLCIGTLNGIAFVTMLMIDLVQSLRSLVQAQRQVLRLSNALEARVVRVPAGYLAVHAQVCACCSLVVRSVVRVFERSHVYYVVFVIALGEFAVRDPRFADVVPVVRLVIAVQLRVFDHYRFAVLILLRLDYFELGVCHVCLVRAL